MPERGLKRLAKILIALACYPATVLLRGNRRIVAINYHAVDEGQATGFRRQMEHLARHYECIAPSAVLERRAPGKPQVAVTFDDAFKVIGRTALPILGELGIPAAICVPSGYIGACPGWEMSADCPDFRFEVMDGDDILTALSGGLELFSHTVTHARLDECDDEALAAELAGSKDSLERRFGSGIQAVCYPYGAFDRRVENAAREAGYSMGFTVEPEMIGGKSDPLSLGRIQAWPDDGILEFALKCSGAYSVFGSVKRWRRRAGAAARHGSPRSANRAVTSAETPRGLS